MTLQLWIGPMWSGKTHAMLCSVSGLSRAKLCVIKAATDNRVVAGGDAADCGARVASRTGLWLRADVVCARLLAAVPAPQRGTVYTIDEAQFFPDLLAFASACAAAGASMHAAGLDLDFARAPFGDVEALAAAAASGAIPCAVHRLAARCTHGGDGACAAPAIFSQRLLPAPRPPLAARAAQPQPPPADAADAVIAVGGAELYQPACASHHSIAPLPRAQWFAGAEPAAQA
jgi:thymidine kinase